MDPNELLASFGFAPIAIMPASVPAAEPPAPPAPALVVAEPLKVPEPQAKVEPPPAPKKAETKEKAETKAKTKAEAEAERRWLPVTFGYAGVPTKEALEDAVATWKKERPCGPPNGLRLDGAVWALPVGGKFPETVHVLGEILNLRLRGGELEAEVDLRLVASEEADARPVGLRCFGILASKYDATGQEQQLTKLRVRNLGVIWEKVDGRVEGSVATTIGAGA